MLIRIRNNEKQLIDILRFISRFNRELVIGRFWRLSDLDIWPYTAITTVQEATFTIFPESGTDVTFPNFVIEGERLMERSALIHQVEAGWFLRIIDAEQAVVPLPGYRLFKGPPTFQASNVDLEIRVDETLYEIVSEDLKLIAFLREFLGETELII